MSVWARAAASAAAAAAEVLTAVSRKKCCASLYFPFSFGEWGPVL